MEPDDGKKREIFNEFEKQLPRIELKELDRYSFYKECLKNKEVILAISMGSKEYIMSAKQLRKYCFY